MGVKSTIILTRKEAVQKYKELYTELNCINVPIQNKMLEDILENMNDSFHNGEGFENYIIRGDE